MAAKQNLGPRVPDSVHLFLEENFRTKNAGAEYVLEIFPVLYRRALADTLKGKFSDRELGLLLDITNGLLLTPALAGQHLAADCADGIALDGLGEKWGLDAPDFLARLRGLRPFDAACLEIWLKGFWTTGGGDWEGYARPLST